MKLRIFFIVLFVCSVLVSGLYFFRFLGQHPHVHDKIDGRFISLLILSVFLQIVAHIIRAYKSRYLLDQVRESRTVTLFKGLSVGYLFNSLLPLRLGEFIRAFYVGDALAISKTAVFISIIIERVVDGIILGATFITAGLLIQSTASEAGTLILQLGITLLILSALLALVVNIIRSQNSTLLRAVHVISSLFNPKISNRIMFTSWSAIYGTRLLVSNRRALLKYCVVSIGMWVVYFGSTVAVVFAFFDHLSFTKSWFVVQTSYAGVSTPAGPGYIGTFALIISHLLDKVGISGSGGFSIFIWLVITIPISIVGLFVLIKQRFKQKKESPQQEALINKLHRERDVSTELGHFLDAYFKGEAINLVLTQAELDGKFKLVKSLKGGSNAQTMLVWQNQTLVVKKITLPQFADKLEDQSQWLLKREHLPHLPRVVGKEATDSYYYFDLEYKEDFFPFFDFIHSHSSEQSFRIVKRMLRFMDSSIYEPVPVTGGRANVQDYIETKVLGKVSDTAAISNEISQLLTLPKLNINDRRYDNILQVIEKIKRHKKAMAELSHYDESPIHGDLTVDNLIASSSGDFLVIDPNNENQVSSPVVDYGKLYQSLHSGYEFLIQLEACQLREGRIDFEDSKSQKYAEIFQKLDEHMKQKLDPKNYRTILFHEGVHYCRMLTYRANINPETLPIFYATAVRLFNEFIAQYE